jgi:hypothetical protein
VNTIPLADFADSVELFADLFFAFLASTLFGPYLEQLEEILLPRSPIALCCILYLVVRKVMHGRSFCRHMLWVRNSVPPHVSGLGGVKNQATKLERGTLRRSPQNNADTISSRIIVVNKITSKTSPESLLAPIKFTSQDEEQKVESKSFPKAAKCEGRPTSASVIGNFGAEGVLAHSQLTERARWNRLHVSVRVSRTDVVAVIPFCPPLSWLA